MTGRTENRCSAAVTAAGAVVIATEGVSDF